MLESDQSLHTFKKEGSEEGPVPWCFCHLCCRPWIRPWSNLSLCSSGVLLSTDFVHSVILLTQSFAFLGNHMCPWDLVFTAQSNSKIMELFTHDYFKYFLMCPIFIFKPVNPLEFVLMQIMR